MALTEDGTVYAWGNNVSGAVGCDTELEDEDGYVEEPTVVLEDCAAIAAGNGHSLAIKNNGDLYAWGNNTYQQLGLSSVDNPDEDSPYQSTPAKVRGGVAEVAANGMHTIIRTRHGSLITFGNNAFGQCGNGAIQDSVEKATLAIVG
jgi:alpha-tubulin suppressor-like RCC1 family protein